MLLLPGIYIMHPAKLKLDFEYILFPLSLGFSACTSERVGNVIHPAFEKALGHFFLNGATESNISVQVLSIKTLH